MRIYFPPNLVDSVQLQVVAISKMKPKEKKRTPSEAGRYNSVKKKNKIQSNLFKRTFLLRLAPENLTIPPNDGEHFSANWKGLQETFKSSQMTNKSMASQQEPNGPSQEGKDKASQNAHQSSVSKAKTDSRPKAKHRTVDPKAKRPVAADAKQPAAAERKSQLKANGKQAAKKQKVEAKESKPTEMDIWFDDVDPDDIEATMGAEAAEIMRKRQGVCKKATASMLVKEKSFEGLTRVVAIDCEMVGVGPHGEDSILARVSLVNHFGKCIYDKYVKPSEFVTDYRTAVSGIRPEDIAEGEDVATVRKEVADILHGRIVVGHAIHNDFKVLLLDHPKKKIRDTQKYKPFKKMTKTKRPSLRVLCEAILNVKVQQGEHSSVQDAQAAMRLYTLVKKRWEADIKESAAERREKRKPEAPENGKMWPGAGLSS